ncbi:MAG TPA: right-handed parallel beta-helix repeat-containing protein [Pseudoxanthomonas sp.]|nr:right-handed parallel beta-helix repeat-containing protein [Pseudoxanthomonas sp.]
MRTPNDFQRQRRLTLQTLALLPALPCLAGAKAAASPPRRRGEVVIDVSRLGAAGAGRDDETSALQAAIDALPEAGGTVRVPAGRYLVNPLRSLRLRDRMHLQLDPDAWLIAIPNAAPRAYVLNLHGVEDVEVSGGHIYGERDRHRAQSGEWGHGIMLRGAQRVTLRDLDIQRCWGDGISIGGISGARPQPSRDVLISDVVCHRNRRQGLTIGRSRQVRVLRSSFLDTGGVLPGCGIDVEPDPGDVAEDVLIQDCLARGNHGAGIQLYTRSRKVQVRGCRLLGNRGAGLLLQDAHECLIEDNDIRDNGLRGVAVHGRSSQVRLANNRFSGNAPALAKQARGERGWMHVDVARSASAIQIDRSNQLP